MLVAEQSLDFMPKVFHSSVIPSYKVLFCQNRSKNEKANDKSWLSLWGDLCTFHQVKCQCYNDFIYQPLNEIASSVFVTVSSTDNKSMLFLWVWEREREFISRIVLYLAHFDTFRMNFDWIFAWDLWSECTIVFALDIGLQWFLGSVTEASDPYDMIHSMDVSCALCGCIE